MVASCLICRHFRFAFLVLHGHSLRDPLSLWLRSEMNTLRNTVAEKSSISVYENGQGKAVRSVFRNTLIFSERIPSCLKAIDTVLAG